MTDALVTRQDKDGCAILTLNRPDKLNAISGDMHHEVRDQIRAFNADLAVGAIVLYFVEGRAIGTERVPLAETATRARPTAF